MRFVVSPPFWYCMWWVGFFAVLLVVVRVVLVNPLVREARALRAEVAALKR